jgi:glycosyltransferase involved in cell wall biosynthesis
MVVRNAVSTIARSLDSVIAQHYPNLEFIVWDGLSNDGTTAILESYAGVITTLRTDFDSGPVNGLNRALCLATGDYIGLLNSDDEYEPGALWAVADSIIKQPDVEVITFGMLYRAFDNEGHELVTGYYADKRQLELTLDNILSENPTFILTRFMKNSVLAEIGPFTEDKTLWYCANDREWMSRLAIRGCRNVVLPKALYRFTQHKLSISSNPDNHARIIEEHLLIATMLMERDDLTTVQKDLVAAWCERQSVFGFWRALLSRKVDKAWRFFKRGLAVGKWRFVLLILYLPLTKVVKRLGLRMSNGIDRGRILS